MTLNSPPAGFVLTILRSSWLRASSLVIAELHELGVEVELKHLALADYIISDKIAVERKTVNDFVSSMLDKRLLKQLLT